MSDPDGPGRHGRGHRSHAPQMAARPVSGDAAVADDASGGGEGAAFGGRVNRATGEMIERQLRALVLDAPFPCLGARSAFRTGSYVFAAYSDMHDERDLAALLAGLTRFARMRTSLGRFYTYVASFVEPRMIPDEHAWERLVWSVLQWLHDHDEVSWDTRWSTSPSDSDFALSIGGLGQLVVTLYPGANRHARRFAWPTLIFNPLEQDRANFPDDEDFLAFQDQIRARDSRLQGNVNPSLPPTLDDPQAPGFSGAPVGADWRCPLTVRTGEERNAG
ncbi:guanitoxin biosynthesis heme-dependent pre-guanitoxin N-hydroxylase GntA [Nocardiopsis mangrovi]|uniref:Guanitoxin biosynthesis heme-dependent pre-guanitoxin N-hydroxylase GntA n=1 Tax=Nocardiopsis mangrovi TaxID=1179818 RepID=A0ABV9DZM3_9ACTN